MAHLAHRRCDLEPDRYSPGGADEPDETIDRALRVLDAESWEDVRRRNGTDGRRKVGKTDGRLRNAIFALI